MTNTEIKEQAKRALGITQLNMMQSEVLEHWSRSDNDMIVYSPTGTGKTLAFALTALFNLDASRPSPQVVIIAPSRELVIQIHGVIKKMSPLTTISSCYGGHNSVDEKRSLTSHPNIVVSTPGRLVDHINAGIIDMASITYLVLDEMDKALELGFSDEMRDIVSHCPTNARKLLTSATVMHEIPEYVNLNNAHTINHLSSQELTNEDRLDLWQVKSHDENKLDTLLHLLHFISDERTIVFANTRESTQQAYEYVTKKKMKAALYLGTLEQIEREKALAMFNNGTVMVLVATDLAARGLDIAEVKHIIHYEMPLTQEIFTHRNGRTARVEATGEAYLITTQDNSLPSYVTNCKELIIEDKSASNTKNTSIATIHISAGKKEKVSRGDIVGFLASHATKLEAREIGTITIHDHYSLVAVPTSKAQEIINSVSPFKLKKQKVKLSIAKPILRFARS